MSTTATETAYYVYGVVAAGTATLPEQRELSLVRSGELAGITGLVSLDEFGEEPLRENLNDRAWLEAKARAHEDVLLAVAAQADVVPLRFGTICLTADEVRALLDGRRDALLAALEWVRGRVELGVKIWVDLGELSQATPSTNGGQGAGGRGYLESRRAAQRRSADLERLCSDVVRGAYDRLRAHAVAGVANRPQPRELTGREETMLLNAAFLVERDASGIPAEVERFDRELRDLGFSFELTGPWPPHNFVESEAIAG